MSTETVLASSSEAINFRQRLIASWALAEGFLGGIMHGLHLPLTGLVIGSVAVCCLGLLAYSGAKRSDLLKATLLVVLIKAMLSPHSPPAAYFAVFVQGGLASLLFQGKSYFKLKCFTLAVITQILSALQHVVVLLIVFGKSFFEAISEYLNKLTKTFSLTDVNFVVYFAVFYVLLHVLAGFITGWVSGKLPDWLAKKASFQPTFADDVAFTLTKPARKKKRFKKPVLVIIWVLLLLAFLQSYFGIGPVVLPAGKVFQVLIRSVLIVSAWYFVLSPLLLKYLHKWLQNKKSPMQQDLEAVLGLLPETGSLLVRCWKMAGPENGFGRVKRFLVLAGQGLFALPGKWE